MPPGLGHSYNTGFSACTAAKSITTRWQSPRVLGFEQQPEGLRHCRRFASIVREAAVSTNQHADKYTRA